VTTAVKGPIDDIAEVLLDAAAIQRIEAMIEKGRSVVREQAPHTEASMDFHVAVADAEFAEDQRARTAHVRRMVRV
jgi:hypothetical protein